MPTERKLKSMTDLLEQLKSMGTRPRWYRGQANSEWKLLPSLSRGGAGATLKEMELLKNFQRHASTILERSPASEWEWLFLMQHHGVATRLLDWSESPMVALYFAMLDHDGNDAALWVLDPAKLNNEANIKLESDTELPSFDHNAELKSYLPSMLARVETSVQLPVAIASPRAFRRVQAQQGAFVVFHRNNKPLEDSKSVSKLVIPSSAKKKFREQLALLGIDHFSLFPELENISKRIKGF